MVGTQIKTGLAAGGIQIVSPPYPVTLCFRDIRPKSWVGTSIVDFVRREHVATIQNDKHAGSEAGHSSDQSIRETS
jgi:hypothetical protein